MLSFLINRRNLRTAPHCLLGVLQNKLPESFSQPLLLPTSYCPARLPLPLREMSRSLPDRINSVYKESISFFGLSQPSPAQKTTISTFARAPYHTLSKTIGLCPKFTSQYPKTYHSLINPLHLHPISLSLILIIFTLAFPTFSRAEPLSSPSYNIDTNKVELGGGQTPLPSPGTISAPSTEEGGFTSSGFLIKTSYEHISPSTPFIFTISDSDVRFGNLVPGTPSIATITLTVNVGSALGYSVKTIADHALKIADGNISIPNTTCDLKTPCTIKDAAPWKDNTRPGLGYNLAGDDIDRTDFSSNIFFRPFPLQGIDSPVIIMMNPRALAKTNSTVTFKANISGSQAAGNYQNNIQYIAIPSL